MTMATVPAPTPLRVHSAEPAVSFSTTDTFFFSSLGKRELQFPRALSAPPRDVALPLTLMPRPPASPGPSLPVCVSDPKAVRGGGTVGGAAAAFSSASNSSSSGSDNSSSGRAAPPDLPAARGAHHKAGPSRASLSSPRSAPRSIGLAGLGGWREGGGLRWCLRSTGARAAPAPRESVRRAELAFRPPAVVR